MFEQLSGLQPRLRPADFERAAVLNALCDPDVLRSVYQPIFRASTGELEGCEALVRFPEDVGYANPAEAFRDAARYDLLLALESAATLHHLTEARGHAARLRLFLNISPPLFSDARFGAPWLANWVANVGLSPSQVVLEIPEILKIRDFVTFRGHLEPFREKGFRIAIDDFGAGYTNLRMITDLSPDFVKVDRVFVDGIASHARKRVLVESVVNLCHRVDCVVIAEGVELPDDLEPCLEAGVDFLQGFLFARPTGAAEAFGAADLALPPRPLEKRGDVRRLLVANTPIASDEASSAAAQRFALLPSQRVIAVVDFGRVVGLLKRAHAVEQSAPGTNVRASDAFDRIAEAASLEEAVELIRRRPEERRYDPLVVVGPNDSYRGLLEVHDLLTELSRLNTEYALQSNPVTRLPGRMAFERSMTERLERRQPFALARLDLRRFRPFNERYGTMRGDDVLVSLASLLGESLGFRSSAFVAHFADDEFAYLASPENAKEVAERILSLFDDRVRELHDPEDAARGTFFVEDRRGATHAVPLVGLSIGLLAWNGEEGMSARVLLEIAELALRGARSHEASSLLVNRRALKTATRLTSPPN